MLVMEVLVGDLSNGGGPASVALLGVVAIGAALLLMVTDNHSKIQAADCCCPLQVLLSATEDGSKSRI